MSALVSAGIAAPLVELSLTECELGLDACTHLSSFTSLRLLDILKPQFDVTDHMQQHVVEICSHAAGPLKLQVDAAALGRSAGAQHWEQALGQRLQAAGITDRVQLPLPLAHAVAAQGTKADSKRKRGHQLVAPRVQHPGTVVFKVLWQGQEGSEERHW
uniref:Uncharacterized protein n=1 Tax=Chlamydomonas leiostraca TaxID=1034604 RepID=A0A7S0RC40_9CHLO|mmetsp:Transcript_19120/g.48564  ORF Transcript_19120/g.48564 Transcript_19120/m.48564 type:complete len:159 (+) Transcript_19120:1031-1507(+)